MGVLSLFPSNVYVEDVNFSEEEYKELKIAIQAIFIMHEVISGSHIETGEDSMPLYTEENIKTFPVLKKLKRAFIEGFLSLAQSFEKNNLTQIDVERMIDNHAGRLPIMRYGDYKKIHCHPGASAFGVFYLSDVDNEKEGGKLILREPSFHTNLGFHGRKTHEIETKACRLVIAPAHIWHDVTPYFGKEDRITVVSNLLYATEDAMVNLRIDY